MKKMLAKRKIYKRRDGRRVGVSIGWFWQSFTFGVTYMHEFRALGLHFGFIGLDLWYDKKAGG